MAYNPYLQNPYLPQYMQQPVIPQPVQQPIQQVQQPIQQVHQPQSNVIWVNSETEARNYPVAPGNTVMLMDNDNPVAYKKSADLSGRAMPLEIYDLVKREHMESPKEESRQINMEEYLTRKEFDSYATEMDKRISEITTVDDEEIEEEGDDVQPVKRRRGRRS